MDDKTVTMLLEVGNAASWWREQAESMERQRNDAFAENAQLTSALEALLALTVGGRHAGGEDDCRVCAAIVAARAALEQEGDRCAQK